MYTKKQEFEINEGKNAGLNTGVYAKEYFEPNQMRLIRYGLEEGLDVRQYAKPELNYDQMYEIYEGLLHMIDVGVYSKEYNLDYLMAEHMKYVRLVLEQGLDPQYLLNPDLSLYQVEEIYAGIVEKVDVSKYAHSWVPDEVMRDIRQALMDGDDIPKLPSYVNKYTDVRDERLQPYIDTEEFDDDQIQQIRLGFEYGINPVMYATPELNWRHMCMIRLGETAGFNMLKYTSGDYGWRQVEQILMGLEDQLDVSLYDDPFMYWADMKVARRKLEASKYIKPHTA